MKILGAKIEWFEGFCNEPELCVTVDSLPPRESLRYGRNGNSYFASTEEGYVSFFYEDKRDKEGYGGAKFDLTMLDGSAVTLVGPWSGNGSGMRAAGFPQSYPVTATDLSSKWSNVGCGINLLEPQWKQAIADFCPDADIYAVPLVRGSSPAMSDQQNHAIGHGLPIKHGDAFVYSIVRRGMTPAQTQADKRIRDLKKTVANWKDEPVWCKGDPSQKERQAKMAKDINDLIAECGMEAFGHTTLDLNNLPPLLPPAPAHVYVSFDPESDYEP